MQTSNKNDNNIEPGDAPEETKPHWALPPEAEILRANPEVRAILYAETLSLIAAAGEEVNPGWTVPRVSRKSNG